MFFYVPFVPAQGDMKGVVIQQVMVTFYELL